MASALTSILNAQRDWAAREQVDVDRGCTLRLDANLFRRPMHPDTLGEFRAGAGDETGQAGTSRKRAKMLSLRSSSVLAVNVFDHWRGRDLKGLARALGAAGDYDALKFEQPFDHGLSTGKPHLDVVLYATDAGHPFAIESKFAEPYDIRNDAHTAPIADKYFAGGKKRWTDLGLPRCQELAEAIGHGVRFERLDAVQLLKHVLGLANDKTGHGAGREVTLLYLWFDTGCIEADEHRDDIADFNSRIDSHLDFRHLTYQELFERLAGVAAPDYVDYLRARYFPSTTIAAASEAPR